MIRNAIYRAFSTGLVAVALSAFGGCAPIAAPAIPAATQKTSNAPTGVFETYRLADPGDLKFWICGTRTAAKGFPYVLLAVQNTSGGERVVGYAPGSVVIHCGPYIQRGPSGIFERRRQILDPNALIVFEPSEGGWAELGSDGQPEMMIPVALPQGKYSIWATFETPGPHGWTLQSDKRVFNVE